MLSFERMCLITIMSFIASLCCVGFGLFLAYGGFSLILEQGFDWSNLLMMIIGLFVAWLPFLTNKLEKNAARERRNQRKREKMEEMQQAAKEAAYFEKLKEDYKNEM